MGRLASTKARPSRVAFMIGRLFIVIIVIIVVTIVSVTSNKEPVHMHWDDLASPPRDYSKMKTQYWDDPVVQG